MKKTDDFLPTNSQSFPPKNLVNFHSSNRSNLSSSNCNSEIIQKESENMYNKIDSPIDISDNTRIVKWNSHPNSPSTPTLIDSSNSVYSLDLDIEEVYIYDLRKKHGYRYDKDLKLYVQINKGFFHKHNPKIVQLDLRPHMDELPLDHIPVHGSLLNCQTLTEYIRDHKNLISYELPTPKFIYPNVVVWMQKLCPRQDNLIHFHNILNSFIRGRGPPCIVVYGPGVESLFQGLLLLKPIIQEGNRCLYSETHLRKRMLESISQARIILTDIQDRTLRFGDTSEFTNFFPIQYRGIVKVQDISQVKSDIWSIELTHPGDISFTASELLGWIIDHMI